MKIIHYPRVSSLRQAKEGDSIESQIKRLERHSKNNNDEVVDTYTDAGKSASISDDNMKIKFTNGKFIIGLDLNKRPGMKRILEEVQTDKWEGIKFVKWDRFSRNSILSKILQIYLERYGKKLIPIEDSTDPLMVEIRGALSQEEVRKMTERVRNTRLLRFEKGMMVGRCPFGYRLDKRKKTIVIDKKEADIVQDAFLMRSKGQGYREICNKHKISPQSYYNIIKNKVYIGIIEFEGKTKRGGHQPIIDEELFNKCQLK